MAPGPARDRRIGPRRRSSGRSSPARRSSRPSSAPGSSSRTGPTSPAHGHDTAAWRLLVHRRPPPLRPGRHLDDIPAVAAHRDGCGRARRPALRGDAERAVARPGAHAPRAAFGDEERPRARSARRRWRSSLTAYYLYRRRRGAVHLAVGAAARADRLRRPEGPRHRGGGGHRRAAPRSSSRAAARSRRVTSRAPSGSALVLVPLLARGGIRGVAGGGRNRAPGGDLRRPRSCARPPTSCSGSRARSASATSSREPASRSS